MANGRIYPDCGGCKYIVRAEPPLTQFEKDCCTLHKVMLTKSKRGPSVVCRDWRDRKETGETLGLWIGHMEDPEMLYEYEQYSMEHPEPFTKFSELRPCPQDEKKKP